MRDFQEKGKIRRLLESRPALFIFTLLILLSAWNLIGFWQKMDETGKNRRMAEEKAAELGASKKNLEFEIGRLESDRGIEEVLRENYGLAREGEGVIVVIEDRSAEGSEAESKKG